MYTTRTTPLQLSVCHKGNDILSAIVKRGSAQRGFQSSGSRDNDFPSTGKSRYMRAEESSRMKLFLILYVFLPCSIRNIFASVDDVTGEFFGDTTGEILAAFGDFNADKLIDIFTISANGQ